MSKNDDKILELKAEVAKKKEELSKMTKKVTTKTNCSLSLGEGSRININTLKGDTLLYTLITINSYYMSAKDLGLASTYKINGYLMSDWMEDLKSRVEVEEYKTKMKELTAMEEKLGRMLSDDKKTELELNDISSMLKGL